MSVFSHALDQPRLEKRRILTDNDWRKIRKIQEKLAEEAEKNHKGKKRKLEEYQEDDVEEDDLLGWKKRQKLDHEERIAAVAAVKVCYSFLPNLRYPG